VEIDPKEITGWIRKRVEISATLPLVLGAASYVAGIFYGAYYGFFFVPADETNLSVSDNVKTALVIFILSVSLIALVYYSPRTQPEGFAVALIGNVPIFFIGFPILALAVYFYLTNVESLSSAMVATIQDPGLIATTKRQTAVVLALLRRWLLLAPLLVALGVVLGASAFRFSFSRFLMASSMKTRLLFLAAYIVLVLSAAHVVGRTTAFLQFVGALPMPDAIVTLADGSRFLPDTPVFLLMRSERSYFFSNRANGVGALNTTWRINEASIKYIQFREAPAKYSIALDYLGVTSVAR